MAKTATESKAPGRNDPCPCGSGKKYKKCCGAVSATSTNAPVTGASYDQAYALYEQGQNVEALSICQSLTAANVRDADAWQLTGIIRYHMGDLQGSAETLEKAAGLQPKNPWTHSTLGAVLVDLGRYDDAVKHCQRAVRLAPDNSDAWINLGNALKATEDYAGARSAYEKALVGFGEHPDVLCNLAGMLERQDKMDEAAGIYKRAIAAAPAHPRAYNQLGLLYHARGQLDEAHAIFEQGLEQQPNDADLWNNLGLVHKDQEQWPDARHCFEKAIAADSRQAGFYVNLGAIDLVDGDADTAQARFQQAIDIDPQSKEAHARFADLLLTRGELETACDHYLAALRIDEYYTNAVVGFVEWLMRFDRWTEGLESLDHALVHAPDTPALHGIRARVLVKLQRSADAIAAAGRAVTLGGGTLDDRMILARVYQDVGSPDLARRECEELTKDYPDSAMPYYVWAELEEKASKLDRARELAEIALAKEKLPARVHVLLARIARRNKQYDKAMEWLDGAANNMESDLDFMLRYLFERADTLDAAGHYDEAFEAYAEAARMRARVRGVGFDFQKLKESQSQESKVCGGEWLTRLPVYDGTREGLRPIFIVGFPRSGTTLLEQMLAGHSRVVAGGELSFIGEISKSACIEIGSDEPYPICLGALSGADGQAQVRRWRQHYLDRVHGEGLGSEGVHWVTDKMPLNVRHLPLIHLLFPDAPVIHIVRHPMDVCLSCMFSNFASGHEWANAIDDAADFVATTTEVVEHYKKELRPLNARIMQVRYEDLVDDPEAWSKRLLEFVGESWEENVLQFHKSRNVARTASYAQVRQPIYKSSVARHKRYEKHIVGPLALLHSAIERYGYE